MEGTLSTLVTEANVSTVSIGSVSQTTNDIIIASIHRLFQKDLWSTDVGCVTAAMKHIANSCSERKQGTQAIVTRRWMAQEPQRYNILAIAMKNHASDAKIQALGCMAVHNSTTNQKRHVHHPAITKHIEATKNTCILQAIVNALKEHSSDRSVQICALGALSRLLQLKEHAESFMFDNSSFHIANAIEKYPNVPAIQRWGNVCLHCLESLAARPTSAVMQV